MGGVMRVLVGCERSRVVAQAFEARFGVGGPGVGVANDLDRPTPRHPALVLLFSRLVVGQMQA